MLETFSVIFTRGFCEKSLRDCVFVVVQRLTLTTIPVAQFAYGGNGPDRHLGSWIDSSLSDQPARHSHNTQSKSTDMDVG